MTENDLDIAIEKCERIMEFDTRTLKNPESENGWIFEKVYDLLKFLRELQFSTGAKVGGMDAVPTVDAVQVVRCKDCKWWHDWNGECYAKEAQGFGHIWNADDYCSYGERKDGGDETD